MGHLAALGAIAKSEGNALTTRRGMLIAVGAMGALALWQFRPRRAPELVFDPVAGLPGFRKLRAVPVSQGGPQASAVLLTGLAPETTPEDRAADARVSDNPCAVLFGNAAQPAMAYFTDIRCPICRVLERDLDRIHAEYPQITRVTHEFPVFGESSDLAARALLAAGPGMADRLRARLMAAPVQVTRAYLGQVVESLGHDPAPILANMYSEATETRLAETRALARGFGFIGTPALVIGDTGVLGGVSLQILRQIVTESLNRPQRC